MQKNFPPLVALLSMITLVLVLITIVAIFYLYITAKNRERLALIEKGMNPNLARSNFWPQVGIIAAGFFGGMVIDDKLNAHFGPLMGFLFAGAGLVIFHVYSRRSKML